MIKSSEPRASFEENQQFDEDCIPKTKKIVTLVPTNTTRELLTAQISAEYTLMKSSFSIGNLHITKAITRNNSVKFEDDDEARVPVQLDTKY